MLQLLQQAPLFKGLDSSDLQPIADTAKVVRVSNGNLLFQEGDACEAFFLLCSGVVRLYRLTPEGKEKVIEIIRAGETFAEAVALLDKPYPVYAMATGHVEMLAIPSEVIREQVRCNQELALKMMANLSRRVHKFLNDIHTLSLSTAQQKVAGYLLAFMDDVEQPQAIHLPATKAMIASRLGLQPETFSRVLRRMKKQGIISEDKQQLWVHAPQDLQRLRDVAD